MTGRPFACPAQATVADGRFLRMFRISSKKTLAPDITELVIEAPQIAAKAEPGQFVIIRVDARGKRLPLTIADFDRSRGLITLVFQAIGKSTRQLAGLEAGASIPDVLGPQGNPTAMDCAGGRVVVVGGGIGIAPVFPLARKFKECGAQVTAIIGYRSRAHVFWEERMRQAAHQLIVTTNDGSYGRQGLVTGPLGELVASGERLDRLYAIGPAPMMRAVAECTRPAGIPTVVSLNSLMVCGMGMCGACRATVGGETRFTCLDGPDFDGHKVDFDELEQRLGTYREEERRALEAWQAEAGSEPPGSSGA